MSGSGKSHVLSYFLNRDTPSIVKAEGVYLYGDDGKRYIDASGGAIVCNIGHGVDEMVDAVASQTKKAAFVFSAGVQDARTGSGRG